DEAHPVMIYYVSREDYTQPIKGLIAGLGQYKHIVQSITYEKLFYEGSGPIGHYIFTDFDRLSSYELESAFAIASTLRAHAPDANIFNYPNKVLERYPLLKRLRADGLNQFDISRYDAGERPQRYPVFIRLEDDCQGPDSSIINNDAEFDQALLELNQQGKTAKRRIIVEFCAELDREGFYRKYGAFNIAGKIVPQHILRNQGWNVKRAGLQSDAVFAAEELTYARENPHEHELLRIFEIAGIDFGRIDYGLVDGAIQTYEINSNATFPDFTEPHGDNRDELRKLVRQTTLDAILKIDTPIGNTGRFRFELPKPVLERPRLPRKRAWRAWLNRALRH
ncbi:MAG: hypothetical protein ACREO2_12030, partial [Arenimonas sp.]